MIDCSTPVSRLSQALATSGLAPSRRGWTECLAAIGREEEGAAGAVPYRRTAMHLVSDLPVHDLNQRATFEDVSLGVRVEPALYADEIRIE